MSYYLRFILVSVLLVNLTYCQHVMYPRRVYNEDFDRVPDVYGNSWNLEERASEEEEEVVIQKVPVTEIATLPETESPNVRTAETGFDSSWTGYAAIAGNFCPMGSIRVGDVCTAAH